MTEQPQRTGLPTAVKVLLILGLVFMLFVGGFVGVCAYCVADNPELLQMGKVMGEAMRMGMAATKAPGTDELREAGCTQAMVMDMRHMAALIKELEKGAERAVDQTDDDRGQTHEAGGQTDAVGEQGHEPGEQGHEPGEQAREPGGQAREYGRQTDEARGQADEAATVTVVCQVSVPAGGPSCEDVAKTYGAAVENPPAEFVTMVQTGFEQEMACSGVFAPDGTKLRELEPQQPESPGGMGPERPPADEGEPLFPAQSPPAGGK